MVRSLLLLSVSVVLAALGLTLLYPVAAQGQKPAKAAPQWVWMDGKPSANQTIYLRKELTLKQRVVSARLYGTCDNRMTVYINGKAVISSDNWESPVFREVTEHFPKQGKAAEAARYVIAIKAHNTEGAAGVLLRLVLENPKKEQLNIVTDESWRVAEKAVKGWNEVGFQDDDWKQAKVVAKLGGAPWTKITMAALTGAAKFKTPSATPIELIKVKKDFKVELLYTVPRQTQGSWVSLCVDPQGRIITADQSGRLYRTTPPPSGGKPEETKVEQLPVDLGEAQGLLWAFDSLYVVVNRAKKYESGLWKVWSSKNDDVLDSKKLLRSIQGSGEHGPHAVILSPDKKSLYVVAGNHTKLTQLSSSKVPQIWGEDFLIPRLWDASGHAVGIKAPAGCIYRVDPEGQNWELISMGYRNEYDIAFNRAGELFTYDSDMEWDMNLPWYRPTRVCHAVPGSEFGWRGGTGKMYEYHPDNLPPVVNVGPGSPTGICFGYAAKFPAKYQEALFICDWSYGKLYAVHLKANGASYTGELEEFMNGTPLPLTDLAVNPKDGALYFAIGGRNALSGLYRVTYVGKESTEPVSSPIAITAEQTARHELESWYGKKDPKAVEAAWPHLSSPDRFLRYAARTVLEFQDPQTWQERALKETNPVALTHALIGLDRVGTQELQPKILKALEGVEWLKLTDAQKIDYLRAYQLAFVRLGSPDAEWKERTGKRLAGFYPTAVREVNAELCKLVCYLEAPGAVGKTLALLAKAPTQEEQIEYALSLRTVRSGWTKMQHEDYFNWFHKAMGYRGGNSFHGFLRNIRTDAIKSLSNQEQEELKTVLANVPQPKAPTFTFKERPFVKKWSVEELVPVVQKGLTGRNFNRGRSLFGEARCFACHRYNAEGGGMGPDLTGVSGRYSPRDLLESIIEPSKTISDQYQAIVVATTDGRVISGRIVNLAGDGMMINPDMLDPNKLINVNRNLIDSIHPSPVSMMPAGLLDTLNQDEILDLVAYLYSQGNRHHKMFQKSER